MARRRVRNHAEMLRDEMVMRPRILALLAEGPLSVPRIARGLGAPAAETMCWVMALRRYGVLAEAGNSEDDGYHQYRIAEEKAPCPE